MCWIDPAVAQTFDPYGGTPYQDPYGGDVLPFYPYTAPLPVPQEPAPRPARKKRSRWHKGRAAQGESWVTRGRELAMPAALPLKLHGGPLEIVIRLSKQRVYLLDGARTVASFPCSTGLRRGATPRGWFRVVEKISRPGWTYKGKHVAGGITANPLGVCWLGLGMPRGWRGAPVGMHGTNSPWVIGHPASHGCIRMLNRHAWTLYRNVPIGTPVHITG